MEVSYLTSITARSMALIDSVLNNWTDVQVINTGSSYKISAACCDVGHGFATSLASFTADVVNFCCNMLFAMGAGSPSC